MVESIELHCEVAVGYKPCPRLGREGPLDDRAVRQLHREVAGPGRAVQPREGLGERVREVPAVRRARPSRGRVCHDVQISTERAQRHTRL